MDNHDIINCKTSIAVIGSGNVATHLYKALRDKTRAVIVNPHTMCELPDDAEIALVCVKDNAISEVINRMDSFNGITAHTSGSVPLEIAKANSNYYGVVYPLQTFTKGIELDYGEIPFFIEGNNLETEKVLSDLARMISPYVYRADSSARRLLHLSSVFACNFTNCLLGISQEILKESGISHKVMLPLLRQTIAKLETLSPAEAQTGPAVRKDFNVMEAHLGMLAKDPLLQQIYRLLSKRIIDNYTI